MLQQNNLTQTLRLEMYNQSFKECLMSFTLPEEQQSFTAMPLDALRRAEGNENKFPVVVSLNGKAVGFFILHTGEEINPFTENENAVLLRAFSINFKEQGKGYGKVAMSLIPQFVQEHFPKNNEIVLAVNMRNHAAKKVYEKAGFKDTGILKEGRIGLQHILHFLL